MKTKLYLHEKLNPICHFVGEIKIKLKICIQFIGVCKSYKIWRKKVKKFKGECFFQFQIYKKLSLLVKVKESLELSFFFNSKNFHYDDDKNLLSNRKFFRYNNKH